MAHGCSKYVLHIVREGGTVAEDVYVGPFRLEEVAAAKADVILRAAVAADAGLSIILRELLPGNTSARDVVDAAQ